MSTVLYNADGLYVSYEPNGKTIQYTSGVKTGKYYMCTLGSTVFETLGELIAHLKANGYSQQIIEEIKRAAT